MPWSSPALHPQAKSLLPINQLECVGDRSFRLESHDGGIEGCERNRIDCDEFTVYIQLKIIVRDDVPGDDFTIGIDPHDRHIVQRTGRSFLRRDTSAFVPQVYALAASFALKRGLGWHDDLGAIARLYFSHRTHAMIAYADRTPIQVVDDGSRGALRYEARAVFLRLDRHRNDRCAGAQHVSND